MIKVFIDSSVLVAACASKTGASAFILGLCRQRKVEGYISLDVIGEARKNVNLKLGIKEKERLKFYLKKANLILLPSPELEEVARCEEVINPKDAPILASALESQVSHIVSLDRKHFLDKGVQKFVKPKIILTPGNFLKTFSFFPMLRH